MLTMRRVGIELHRLDCVLAVRCLDCVAADMALTLIFLVELLINYFANAFMAFWEVGFRLG
eukprot:3869888-Rhodomonas_salina.2